MQVDLILQGENPRLLAAETLLQPAGGTIPYKTREGLSKLCNVPDTVEFRKLVDTVCFAEQVDYGFMPHSIRLEDYGLLVMDMDSTLITIECIDELADIAGVKPQVAAITEATMRGEIKNFEESLRQRVSLLRGLDTTALDRVYNERLNLTPGAESILSSANKAGLKILLLSGGFTFFTDQLKHRLKLDFAYANILEINGNKLTGNVLGKVVDANEKARLVKVTCDELGIPTSRAIVIGDGANDLEMLKLAGISVAFHAKPALRGHTTHSINFGGLDVMLDWFERE